jgi:two-component system, NtrC family, response regulator AtoC
LSPARILLVDDDEALCLTLGPHLSDLGHEVLTAGSGEKALNHMSAFKPDIVFTDVQMPGMDGFELLAHLRKACPDVDVIIITGYGGVQGAIDAIREGASDYLLKPLDLDEIEAVIERCMDARRTRQAVLDEASDVVEAPGGLVGRHPSMLGVYKTIGAVSASRAAVLLRGETGTGKELIARTIHGNSRDANEPFIGVNCAAVPETLLESTLFGHVRGAFTGAVGDRRGPFELAGHGTIFLDEIGDTSLPLQAKLLRVLEEREFYPVGSEHPRRTEARVIAATNRDLEEMVVKGEFRDDLFFRLRVIEIFLPPLRERRSDIPLLVRHILSKAAVELGRQVPGVSREVMGQLMAREWPGNIRELENALTRALVMARGNALSLHDLEGDPWASGGQGGDRPRGFQPGSGAGYGVDEGDTLAAVEKRHVQRVLLMTKGNKTAASRILEVSRPTLNRMIKDYEIFVP